MEAEHVEAYKKISAQLNKKGLLHKPNYGALVDQLTALSGAFKREGNYHFAALCHLSVARCEHILKNTTLEASAFVDAGHAFWGAATEAHEAALLSFDENVTEAINCYTLAIEIYIAAQQKSMAATLYYEIAVLLKKLGKYSEACTHFQRAAELQTAEEFLPALNALQAALECAVMQRDYVNACIVLNWIIKLASEAPDLNDIDNLDSGGMATAYTSRLVYPSILVEARISLVLLLTLQGEFQQAREYISKLTEDASHAHKGQQPEQQNLPITTTVTMSLLHDLVTACEERDAEALRELQSELWGSLTPAHNELVHRIELETFS